MISFLGDGIKVHGIYNQSSYSDRSVFSNIGDVQRCILKRLGVFNLEVDQTVDIWTDYLTNHGPDVKILHICHSGGSIIAYKAIQKMREELRKKITIITFAPATSIPKSLCFDTRNYVSKRDLVPYFNIIDYLMYGEELCILEPHPNASFWDHAFASLHFYKNTKISYR